MINDEKTTIKNTINDLHQTNNLSDFVKDILLKFVDTDNEDYILVLEELLKSKYTQDISNSIEESRDSPYYVATNDKKKIKEAVLKYRLPTTKEGDEMILETPLSRDADEVASYAIKSLIERLVYHKGRLKLEKLLK